ncbi:MAG: SEL1-like repeat protein [Candidatus Thiodiazotropha sp. (ex Lucinoma aequizonata)]|nr:SEL1-like repeat protein [Candidatus Thiodiazotropha sp. (ex Lucinoma aequizonata)]MCU7887819.1 SEL1-like repeat protein [Candidatus Thiodiazotropha sp. (ex Lucinoma aequizonata)]MCU7895552.1 SEL1-like repeat protein [Candidatus Thiodiazotropha sp. (ex Lucinoma aequizonata)]MCU7899067.1 SEL1-like repeat protein [Candidatus Thiodiazotropha sp. (ex Lucinoma aequizonata)]MCU7903261.1 SEL1-like repeat protein [Candidatus Thiodiazotropha sp. (ex Lucinoma aequizonata)]
MQTFSHLKPLFLLLSLLSGLVVLSGCSTTPDDKGEKDSVTILQEAHRAYNIKAYKKVFGLIIPLATAGNDRAEYALGYLYYYGLGIEKNDRQAMHWIQRAAAQGNRKAQKALILNN